ncbi:1495_t:CDS:1, partial [Gigaspora margarita]
KRLENNKLALLNPNTMTNNSNNDEDSNNKIPPEKEMPVNAEKKAA